MNVLTLLESEALTPLEIARRLGKKPASIRSYLYRLVREGVVTRLDDGRYALVAWEEFAGPANAAPLQTEQLAELAEKEKEITYWRRKVGQLQEELGACYEKNAELRARVRQLKALLEQKTGRLEQLTRENRRLAQDLEDAMRAVAQANSRFFELLARYNSLLEGTLSSGCLQDLLRKRINMELAAVTRRLAGF